MHFASFNIWLFGGVMFQVTKEEWNVLRSQIVTANPAEYQSVEEWRLQIVTSNFAKMGLRRPPYAFTRNGIGGNALSAKVT